MDNTALYTEIVSGDATVPWVCKANELKFQSIHIYITSFVLNIVSETPFCHYKGPAVGTTNQIGFYRSVRVDLNVKRDKKIRATFSFPFHKIFVLGDMTPPPPFAFFQKL